jgi:hypothetical protein
VAPLSDIVSHLPLLSAFALVLALTLVMPRLAAAVAAYRTVNSAGVRLLDEVLLNAILVLVVLSSVAGPLLTERYGRTLATEVRNGA